MSETRIKAAAMRTQSIAGPAHAMTTQPTKSASMEAALQGAEAQLAYWTQECEAARRAGDAARIARCEEYIAQCERMLAALKEAKAGNGRR